MFTKSRSDCLPLDYWPEECMSKASGGETLVVKYFLLSKDWLITHHCTLKPLLSAPRLP